MTREEELIRIAKKLDKMVSRNNTVRYLFGRLLHIVFGFVLCGFFSCSKFPRVSYFKGFLGGHSSCIVFTLNRCAL